MMGSAFFKFLYFSCTILRKPAFFTGPLFDLQFGHSVFFFAFSQICLRNALRVKYPKFGFCTLGE